MIGVIGNGFPRRPRLLEVITARGVELDWTASVVEQPVPDFRGVQILAKLIRWGFGQHCAVRPSSLNAHRASHLPGRQRRVLGELILERISRPHARFVQIDFRLKQLRVFPRERGQVPYWQARGFRSWFPGRRTQFRRSHQG